MTYPTKAHVPQSSGTSFKGGPEVTTGKIAWAHLNEFPDYYTRLEQMEGEAERDWAARRSEPAG